jgi:hypothetical protein
VATTNGSLNALASFGTRLYVGGRFTQIAGLNAANIASYDAASWSAVGSGLDGPVHALHAFDDGGGASLYAGGAFTNAIARWNGASWSGVDDGIRGVVYELETFPEQGGPALYAAGVFSRAGAHASVNIAKFARVGPACAADWNRDTLLNTQDLFDFLKDFFLENADFNDDGTTNSQDFFDFVEAFMLGC